MTIAPCAPCVDYWDRRSDVVLPALVRRATDADDFEDRRDAFIEGVHQRHLDGLSLFVCDRCACTPEKPCDTKDQMLEANLCSACVARRIRYAILYSAVSDLLDTEVRP